MFDVKELPVRQLRLGNANTAQASQFKRMPDEHVSHRIVARGANSATRVNEQRRKKSSWRVNGTKLDPTQPLRVKTTETAANRSRRVFRARLSFTVALMCCGGVIFGVLRPKTRRARLRRINDAKMTCISRNTRPVVYACEMMIFSLARNVRVCEGRATEKSKCG